MLCSYTDDALAHWLPVQLTKELLWLCVGTTVCWHDQTYWRRSFGQDHSCYNVCSVLSGACVASIPGLHTESRILIRLYTQAIEQRQKMVTVPDRSSVVNAPLVQCKLRLHDHRMSRWRRMTPTLQDTVSCSPATCTESTEVTCRRWLPVMRTITSDLIMLIFYYKYINLYICASTQHPWFSG